MKKNILPLVIVLLSLCFKTQAQAIHPDANSIFYVDSAAAAGGDGSSWATAVNQLSDALKAAQQYYIANPTIPIQIWVTSGTYYPLYAPVASDDNGNPVTDRDKTFLLPNHIIIIGGFNGTETTPYERSPVTGKGTILSGDIGIKGDASDNAYHVAMALDDGTGSTVAGTLYYLTVTGGDANGAGSITVNGFQINRNQGGGLYAQGTVFVLENCLFAANYAADKGGGIMNVYGSGAYVVYGGTIAISSTFANNNAGNLGNDIFNYQLTDPMYIINSILADGIDYTGTTDQTDILYSLVKGKPADAARQNLDGNTDPHFKNAAAGDYRLARNSPAINAGWNEFVDVEADSNVLDLAGYLRIYDRNNGGIIDMGAFEYGTTTPDISGILYVDSAAAPGGDGSSWATALPQLSDALKWAREQYDADTNWLNGDSLRIFIAKGTYLPNYNAADGSYNTDGGRDNAFVMVKNVQLYGGFDPANGIDGLDDTRIFGATGTILSGDIGATNSNTDNVYHVLISAGDVGNALLDGLTISGGNANGNSTAITINGQSFSEISGGGIYNTSSSLSISNTSISDNTANNRGGGIYNAFSSPSISSTTISGNMANAGGGIFNFSAFPSITNTTISGNTANAGGGIYNNYFSSPSISSTTISGNMAYSRGGGMYNNYSSSPTIINSTISGNMAYNTGGGIFSQNTSSPFLYNSIVLGNNTGIDGDIDSGSSHNLIQTGDENSGGELNGTTVSNSTPGDIFVNPITPGISTGGNLSLKKSPVVIEAGGNQLYTDAGGDLNNDLDLAGNPRLFGTNIDLGAYEYQGTLITPDTNGILYVDSASAPGGDGSSWATALPQLADALKAAEQINTSTPGTVKQIWVTSGTYYPLYAPEANLTDRDKTFMLVKDVAVLGGFAGTETDLNQHSPVTGSGTVLSGDIGVPGNTSDNAYHVVTATGDVADGTQISGFSLGNVTITSGNANATGSIQVKGRTIWRNEGGGLVSRFADPVLSNCLFVNNSAVNGGAILNAFSNGISVIVNCTFAANADTAGKAIYYYNTEHPLQVTNSIIMDGIGYYGTQTGGVTYSLVQGIAANPATHNLDGNTNPYFKNVATGDYRLAINSPAINAGNNSVLLSYDLAGYPRIYDQANGGIIDLGTYEFQGNPIRPDANGIMYVDSAAAPGGGDGSSWANALPQLADALKAAEQINTSTPGMVKQIWITSGTYYPLYAPEANLTDRDKTFMLVKDVAVLGGFAGTETDLNQRSPVTGSGTVLSGDIGVPGNTSDNAYHVVTATGDVADGTQISGFSLGNVTITSGNANATGSIQVKGRTIWRNEGGGLVSRFADPVLSNCLFVNNSAVNGGAILNAFSNGISVIVNCTFAANADTAGKAIYYYNTEHPLQVTNSIIMDGIGYYGTQTGGVTYSLVQGIAANPATHNLDGNTNPYFKNVAAGDYRLAINSPAINAGNNSVLLSYDLAGNPRIYDQASGGIIDIGAYELQSNPIRPDTNNILYVDSAAAPGGDGSSWANALPRLSDALHFARENAALWDADSLRIYVAKGTYLPEYRADDRSKSVNDRNTAFVMLKNVQLYGGYPTGGGTRNPAANPSILSGDIGTANDTSDNAYHVVISAGDVGNALLNGFTITQGNATGTGTITVNGQTVQVIAGGGVYNLASDPLLTNVIISGNTAGSGGGMYNIGANPRLMNVVISGNTAGTNGGGIRNFNNSGPVLTNVTISGNTANAGGGIANNASSPVVNNSILYGNHATTGQNIINDIGNAIAFQYSLMEGGSGWNSAWGTDGGNNVIAPTSPFADADTKDYRLTVASPAVDAGSNTLYINVGGNLAGDKDLSGNARVYNQTGGGIIDIGAYEFQGDPAAPDINGILYVDSAIATPGDGSSWDKALQYVSDATQAANTNSAAIKEIHVAKGTYYPTGAQNRTNRDNTFALLRSGLKLLGGYPNGGGTRDAAANTTVLSGNIASPNDNTDNSYHVMVIAGLSGSDTLTIDGFTITKGNADSLDLKIYNGIKVTRGYGGGLAIYQTRNSRLVIAHCTISENMAYIGGGIYNDYSSPLLTNVRITYNSVSNSGTGMYNWNNSSPILTNVTVAHNRALEFSFSGQGIVSENCNLTLNNSIVYGNSRSDGVIDNLNAHNSTMNISHSLLQGDPAAWTWGTASSGTDAGGNIITDADPFKDAANNDFSASSGSPSINTGSNQLYTDAGGDLADDNDLAGNARVYNQAGGGIIDMGAYELQSNPVRPDANGIIYVDSASAVGGGDGSSWANALPKLSDALHFARENAALWDADSLRIYVAKGTYLPEYRADDRSNSVNDRNAAFVMVKNVQIYGGYPTGGGTRNPAANPSILSGDIGTANDTSDNAYHVVISAGDVGNALLNGFTITQGNATGTGTITVNGQTVQVIAGGGVYNLASDPLLTNVIISGNTAGSGGGMYNIGANPRLMNVVISGNTAGTNGGGIRNFNNSGPVLTNVTISGNTANSGGGMANHLSSPTVVNSILFGNTAATEDNIINTSGQAIAFQYSLMEGDSGWDSDWGTDGGNNVITGTSPFAGIETGNYGLTIASPAVNAGSNTLYIDAGGNLADDKDLSGEARVYNQTDGGIIDMGAYEFQGNPVTPDVNGILYVDSAIATPGDGSSWNKALQYLSDATQAANANNTVIKEIHVAEGTYYATGVQNATDRDNSFALLRAGLKLLGGYPTGGGTRNAAANTTTLSGDIGTLNDSTDNSYHVMVIAGLSGSDTLTVDGFTITKGNASTIQYKIFNGVQISRSDGGGLASKSTNNAIIAISNCHFLKNTAGGYGGGIFSIVSSPRFTNLTISQNSAYSGGGIANHSCSPQLTNVIIDNNIASQWGGGVFTRLNSAPVLKNVLIANNTADQGAGVANLLGSPILINVTVANNHNSSTDNAKGAGVFSIQNSHPELNNSIVYGNLDFNGTVDNFYNVNSSTTSVSYSLLQGNPADWTWGTDATGTDAGGNIITDTDPFKDTAGDDFSLNDGSPAINIGSNTLYTNAGGNLSTDKDLAGNARVYNQASGGIIDMGAYEYQDNVDVTKIISQPKDSTGCEGTDASFTVTATGDNLSYQWQSSTNNGATWNNIPTATTTTLTISNTTSADSGSQYRAIVAGDRGIDTSASATLHVNAPVIISLQPTDTAVVAGDNAAFSVAATGTINGYQWQISTDGINWSDITNETTETLVLSNVGTNKNGDKYRTIITGACSNDTSTTATLMVNTPVLTLGPVTLSSGYVGVLYPKVTFSATGGVLPYTYTETGTLPNGMTFADGILSGTPSQSGNFPISVTATDNTAENIGGPFSVTKDYTLVINTGGSCINVSSYPHSQTVCEGSNVSFTINASGETGYQWQNSSDGGKTWADINGETNATLSLTNVVFSETPAQYRVIVKSNCGDITSGSATLTVHANAAIIMQPKDITVCENGNATFSVIATGTNISYQWQSSTDGNTWNDMANDTTDVLQVSSLTRSDNGKRYRVIISSSCNKDTSGIAKLTINSIKHTTLNETICFGSTYNFGGENIFQSGKYLDTLASYTGCDSIVVLNLTVRPEIKTELDKTICFGSAYNFGGTNLSQAGTYYDTLQAATGCDSIVVLNLTIRSEIKTTLNKTICFGDDYNFDGTNISQSGTYSDTLISYTGCDSVVILNLTVRPEIKTTLNEAICNGSAYNFGGNNISQSGTYYDTLQAATGCDSIVVLNLQVRSEIKTALDETICNGSAYNFGGTSLSESGTYYDTLQAATGCDSIVVLNLTIRSEIKTTLNKTICFGGAYNFDGTNISQSGTYSDTLISYTGCDSVVILNLTVRPEIKTTLNEAICNGSAYNFGGNNISQSGTYYDTLQAATGCDSIVVLNLQVRSEIKTTLNKTICNGSAYSFGGENISQSGTYKDTLTAAKGCDSIVVLNLTVRPEIKTTLDETICFGSVYNFNGTDINQSGTYTDTLTSYSGCDSVVVLNLTVRPENKTTINQTICEGDTYTVGNNKYTQSGTYHDTLVSYTSCDSIVVLHLTVNVKTRITVQPVNKAVCEGSNATFKVKATGTKITYQWQSSKTGSDWKNLNGATKATLNLSDLTATDNGMQFRVVVTGTCETVTSDAVTLTVNPLPTIKIVSDKANPVSKGLPIQLTASGADLSAGQAGSYQWASGPGIQSGWNEATVTIRPVQDATYTVTGTTAAGCKATQNYDIKVVVDYKLICNNIVSPNGDGKNDRWIIQNIDAYPVNEVMIFDRAGRMIYHKKTYDNQWDGTVIGRPLQEGTYYYVFKVDGGKKIFKGFIQVLR